MNTAIVQARVSKIRKEKARQILAEMGMDLSGAINLYLAAIVTQGRIPFTPQTRQEFLQQLRRGHEEYMAGKSLSAEETEKLLGL